MLGDEKPAIPCGLVAKSFFNDTFKLYRTHDDGSKEEIEIDQKNIAWTSDVESKFRNVMPSNGVGSW